MKLTMPELIKIRQLILRWSNAIGKSDDRCYVFPKCLEEIKIVRYNNIEDPDYILNGHVGLWIATLKEKNMPVIVFETKWFEVPEDQFVVESRVTELLLSNKDERQESNELQNTLGKIEDDDFLDMHIYFKLLDNGIDIFSKGILDRP